MYMGRFASASLIKEVAWPGHEATFEAVHEDLQDLMPQKKAPPEKSRCSLQVIKWTVIL